MNDERLSFNRRRFLACLSAMGLGATLMPEALTIAAQDSETITVDMLAGAEKIAGISFTPDERRALLDRVNGKGGYIAGFEFLRSADLGNAAQPAIVFNPVPRGKTLPIGQRGVTRRAPVVTRPATEEALAFLPLTHLAKLVETRQVTSSDLTELYLSRLKKYDPVLHCVISLTEDLARTQAREADAEISAGRYRGPLHGIPFGIKDLFAVRGTKTTWGASPYRDQVIDLDATVYVRLREAGAVLIAKLSSGALALTARWFGGVTRNPWNVQQDAAGSSAGPGSATAAGLVGFSVGTDTGGSIISPAARNGITGMRPTFGRVSRYGAMSLAWTQDTVGPMCRSAEDCGLVFNAIYGPDGRDNSVLDVPFAWDATADVSRLRVGCLRSILARGGSDDTLRVIRDLGISIVPFDFPEVSIEAIDFIRYAETAAAFDELTRSGKLRQMEQPPEDSPRPAEIRPARFIPAVEYIQANRYRMRVMQQMDEALAGLDVFIGTNLLITNRTGHPAISLPNGFAQGSPTSLQMTGKLFGEPELLLLAHAFQSRTDHHLKHPAI